MDSVLHENCVKILSVLDRRARARTRCPAECQILAQWLCDSSPEFTLQLMMKVIQVNENNCSFEDSLIIDINKLLIFQLQGMTNFMRFELLNHLCIGDLLVGAVFYLSKWLLDVLEDCSMVNELEILEIFVGLEAGLGYPSDNPGESIWMQAYQEKSLLEYEYWDGKT